MSQGEAGSSSAGASSIRIWQREHRSSCGPMQGWYMSGNGGNVVVILPGADLVVVVTRRHYNQRGMHLQTVRLIEDHLLPALPCPSGPG